MREKVVNKINLNLLLKLMVTLILFLVCPIITNAAKVGDYEDFDFEGKESTFTAPVAGYYRLEVWGAQGGSSVGGYGGYSTGIVKLNKEQTIYVNVGGQATNYVGGYNGGGDGNASGSYTTSAYGGGGATHIALSSGLLKTFASKIDDILIVAGAGGGTSENRAWGGAGGGYIGNNGANSYLGYGGTQTDGAYRNGSFGQGGYANPLYTYKYTRYYAGGGGGGFYGGGGGDWSSSASSKSYAGTGGGGSGYIGNPLLTNKAMYCWYCSTSDEESTKTFAVDQVSADPVSNYAKIGHGFARITLVQPDYVNPKIKELTLSSGTFNKKFDPDTYEYDITMNSEITRISIDAIPMVSNNEIIGLGEVDIPVGTTDFVITSTSESGHTAIYVLHITRQASSYRYLQDLKVDGKSINNFTPENLNYVLNVPYNVESLDVEAIKARYNQTISMPSDFKLNSGTNNFKIVVVSEDGKYTTDYNLTVNREHSAYLKSIEFGGYISQPEFDPETLMYTVNIMSNAMGLAVNAIPFDEEATVSYSGFGYIKTSGTGTITVTEPNSQTKVYKINIVKEGFPAKTEYTYSCTGSYQKFVAPATGFYQIELWGAQGGYGSRNSSLVYRGGYGAYTTGTVKMNKDDEIYVYVGCQGSNAAPYGYSGGSGGYNGGSKGGDDGNHDRYPDAAGGGGGATDIRLKGGSWNNFDSLKSRLMVAAGGGGGSYEGYGYAGGLYKNKENAYGFGYGQAGYTYTGGTGGGGGGYFGGMTVNSDSYPGFGGTSYVSGAEDYFAIDKDSTSDNITLSNSSVHYSGIEFTDIEIINGNNSMPGKSGGYSTGSQGHGYAKITLLPQPSGNNFLSQLNVKVNGVDQEYTPTLNFDDLDYYINYDDPNITEATIVARPEDSKAKITGTGVVEIKAGENIYDIEVTAENGDVRTYKVHITRPASDNQYPDNIIISGLVESLCSAREAYCKLDPAKFDKDTNTYRITVPSRIKQLWFDVEKGHPYQEVEGEGKYSLEGGENEIVIKITSEDGQHTSEYKYIVTRDMTGNTDLSRLEIIDPERNINYDPDILEYYLTVPNDYTEIREMIIETDDKDATYVVTGNENFNTGMNQVFITVTAQNKETRTYILNVYREKNENVYLSSLKVKHGQTEYSLVPEFNKINTGTYRVTVPNEIDNVDIIATAESSTTTVTGDGNKKLNTGTNKYVITTTAENENITEKYTLEIIRAKNSNANLIELNVKNGETQYTLSPTFDKNTTEYNVKVPEGTSTIDITATPEVSTTTYKLLDNNTIKAGKNVKRVMAIAEDGTTKTYIINITRPANTDNYLKDITLTSGTLDPEFKKEHTIYDIEVENEVSSITINGIKNHPYSTVKGNGTYSLAVGKNEITLTVTAEDGSSRKYFLNITRKPNTNAYLKLITTSEGILSPGFEKQKRDYSINVENTVDKIVVIGTPEAKTTKVTGNGEYKLHSGSNIIKLTTLAEDGVTSLVYTIDVYRDKSDNDNLSYLLMEEGAISPKFNPNIISYTASVPYEVTKGTFHIQLEDENATYKILGNSNFKVGENTVEVVVTSESNLSKTYTIVVTRQEKENYSNYLANLSVKPGTLDPKFDKEQQYYEVEVPHTTTKITVNAAAEDIMAEVNGTGTYSLDVGKNLVTVNVISVDGKVRDYQIVITRRENNDARLSNLEVSGSNLVPIFDRDIFEYKLNTTENELTFNSIVPVDKKATYEILGNSNFNDVGEYQLIIRVTAADKETTQDYILHVTKDPSNNNNLASLSVEGYTINPNFNKATTIYYLTVGNEVNSVNIIATPEEAHATISGDGNRDLMVGINNLVVEVTSESGKVKSYTIVVTKLGSDNNNIDELIVNNGTMSPEFKKDTTDYNVTIPYQETELDLTVLLEDENATYIVVGNSNLKVGQNTVNVIVTAENGSTKTYTLNVTREEIVSALLENLKVKNYELTPTFNSYVTNYDLTVNFETEQLDLTVIPLDKNATYQITGNENFVVGDNTVTILVTARDGVTQETYTLNVKRQKYANTFLDYLYTSEGDVKPLFKKDVLEYSIDVDYNVDSIELFGEAVDKSATVTGIGVHSLEVGPNVIPITITSTSGAKRIYYVTVNRQKNKENYLLSLSVSRGSTIYTLNPTFDKTIYTYDVTVPVGTPNVLISATTSETATITGAGTKTLKSGLNQFIVSVISQSGEVRTYTINITREASNNNFLTNLIPSIGTLDPIFSYDNVSYTLELDSAASLLSFTYATEDASARVTGAETQIVPDGTSTRQIVVEAENGTTKTYYVTVIKERTDNAKLSDLSVVGYPFDIPFNSDIYEYHITVPNSKKVLLATEVKATTSDPNAKITKSGNLNLSTTSPNEYIVTVTAPDTFTKQEYKIIIEREKGQNTLLQSLVVNKGNLTTIFNPNVFEYTWMVPKNSVLTEEDVRAIAQDENAIIEKSSYVEVKMEGNKYFVKVTAEDGSDYTEYILNAVPDLSADTTLASLDVDKGYYEPEFDPNTLEYDVYEYVDTESITVTAKPNSENSKVTKGNGEVLLENETTIHEIEVTAEDGSTSIYKLTIHKTILKDEGLVDLGLKGFDNLDCLNNKCILKPKFETNTLDYKIRVPYEYTNLDIYYEKMNDQQTVKFKVFDEYFESYNLPTGKTEVQVEVYDGLGKLTKTYTIEIDRGKSNNNYLKSLVIDDYELDPIFNKYTQEYTIYIEKEIEEVNIKAEPEDGTAYTLINGNNYLQEGNNDATIDVVAPDGSIRTYVVHIIKDPLYNSYIKNITVSTGIFWELKPNFKPTTFEYTTTITSLYDKATVEAVPIDPTTIITGTGEYQLKTGSNVITLVATSADNASTSIYTINVIKLANNNVDLESLIVEEGVLQPKFERGTTNYDIKVPSNVDKLTIHAVPSDKTSTVLITGNENLIAGNNIVNIIVMNKDKTMSKTYQLNVFKEKSNNKSLSSIKVHDEEKEYALSPNFDKAVTNYNIKIPHDVEKVTIEATPDDKMAVVMGTGEEYLDYGNNEKMLTVVAENGDSITYKLNLYREYNLDLISIISDTGTLNPEFKSDITEYTIDVPSDTDEMTFIAFAASNKVKVTGNGSYELKPGANEIIFKTTDPDNHQKTYKVTVNRANDGNNYIKELSVNGFINPAFDKLTQTYSVDVRENVDHLDLGVILESSTATYEILNNSNFNKNNNPNQVTIRVTAENKKTRDYVLNVNLQPDEFFTNRLLNITVNPGTLSPTFNPDINNYIVTVENSVSEITIDTVKENDRSTITYNGQTNNVLPLSIGRNVIEVKVTDPDGNAKYYYIVVYRGESNDATLKNLVVKDQTFYPIFSPIQDQYNLNVSGNVTNLDIVAIPTDPNSTVSIKGDKNLVTGTNTVTIKVTAPDGVTTKTYTITVDKGISTNNYLSDLNVSGYTFDKKFTKTNQGPYIINVPSSTNSILVNATPEVETTTVTGDGVISLTSGKNVITVNAISESGDVRPYTIMVNKSKSSDSSLKEIILSDEYLEPDFNKDIFRYTITVPEELDSITVTGIPTDPTSTVTGNDTYSITEDFTISLEVTAEDGNKSTYKIDVIRDVSSNSRLASLVVKDGELYPGFHKLIESYTILVPNEVRSLNMEYKPEDPNATVTVTGNENFKVGSNTVKITVVSADGNSTTEYTINVVRQTIASNYLKYLEVEGFTINPEFDKTNLYYEVTVPIDVETVKINAEVEDPTSSLSGTGYKSVKKGINRFYVTVESASGVIRSYQVVINRVESSENFLLTLESDVGTLDPVFNSATNKYTLTVPSGTEELTLTGTASENALVVGLGKVKVNSGSQTQNITVTSESGQVNTYAIEIIRPSSDNTELKDLIPSFGTLEYSNDKLEYELEVPGNQSVISFTATPKDENAKVTGTDLKNLEYGENDIKIIVTAEDGVTTRTIKVKVTRMKELIEIIPSETSIIITKDEEKEITYTLNPEDTSYPDVEWISSDETIATVDQDGKITGVEFGSTTVQIVSKHDATIFATINVNVMNLRITSQVYDVVRFTDEEKTEDETLEEYVIGAEPQLKIDEFLDSFDNSKETLHVYDMDGNEIEDYESFTATKMHMKLIIEDKEYDEITVIVRGDVTGDGIINAADYNMINSAILRTATLNKVESIAADVTQDEIVNAADYNKINMYILRQISSVN